MHACLMLMCEEAQGRAGQGGAAIQPGHAMRFYIQGGHANVPGKVVGLHALHTRGEKREHGAGGPGRPWQLLLT